VFFGGVVAYRFFYKYEPSPVFWIETSVFALIVLGYLRRTPPRERAATPLEVVLPLLGGPAPFALLVADWHPLVDQRAIVALWLAGASLSAVSYAFLGGSFSILVEARELRSGGPYRFVRHPVYLGQIIAATGSVLGRFVWWNVALGVAFAAIQVARAVLEERKLLAAVPGYAEYRARTWMFVPFTF
jgi:protein-S-isoprenylcysteine O-methyltransferase Ste14